MDNGFATVKLTHCIGCGLCVPTCPEEAMILIKKDKETVPPLTVDDLFNTVMAQKSSFAGKMRNYSMKTFLRVASRFSN